MRAGSAILLIVLGAALAFAIDRERLGPVNLDLVGWIMMGGGVLGVIVEVVTARSRRTVEVYDDRF